MANAQEIKARIKSISDTKKVTGAMYMISSIKMRKAKREVDSTEPYFKSLKEEIGRVFRCIPEIDNPYFMLPGEKDRPSTHCGLLVITADKGLAGAYNQNAIEMAEKFCGEHPGTELFVVGEYGRQYLAKKKYHVCHKFFYNAENPSVWVAKRICMDMLDYYETGKLDEIDILYTDFKNGIKDIAKINCLLPLERSRFKNQRTDGDVNRSEYEFSPDPNAVLNNIIPSYLAGYIYSALTDSFCSEQSARMKAMDSAGRNADKILHELKLEYNSVRQSAITREITEVTAGAKALRGKQTGSAPDKEVP